MTGSVGRRGWFADYEEDAPVDGWNWQPFLQLDGSVAPLETWFKTEADCVAFIRDEILGQGMSGE